ncbi:hypothetical protein ABKN59_004368 [Abortiporus biennis]
MSATRPPPRPLDQPPAYGVVARVYRASLRPVVVTFGIITAIWTLIWAIDLFQDINIDKDHGTPKLAKFSIVLGIMYLVVCVIQIFGIAAAASQRLRMAQVYTWLAVFGAVTVVAAGFMRVVTHFTLKSDLIKECENVVTDTGITFRFGIWGPTVHDTLNATEAESFCNNGWSHDSANEIISLIFEIILGGFIIAIAFSYYRQLLDPLLGRVKTPAPINQTFADAAYNNGYPSHYNPPYLAYEPGSGPYAPPPGPPPDAGYGVGMGMGGNDSKPPGYEIGGFDMGTDGKRDVKNAHGDDDDPFADFEGQGGKSLPGESRDRLV